VTTPPSHWRDSAMSLAWTVLVFALMLYVAARLIVAVWPVLVVVGVVALVGLVGRAAYQYWQSRW
jgi:hypothetical protein